MDVKGREPSLRHDSLGPERREGIQGRLGEMGEWNGVRRYVGVGRFFWRNEEVGLHLGPGRAGWAREGGMDCGVREKGHHQLESFELVFSSFFVLASLHYNPLKSILPLLDSVSCWSSLKSSEM